MMLILAALFVATAHAGNNLCCGNPCESSSECSAGMFCCPFRHVCMDRSTKSTGGPACDAYCCQDSVLGDGSPDPRCPYLANLGYCSDPKYKESMKNGCTKSCGLCASPYTHGIPEGMLGVSAYNDHYYCFVKSACWERENFAVFFEVNGDDSFGAIQDPMGSALATSTTTLHPASKDYTQNEALKIAGKLIFSGVPKSGKVTFTFGRYGNYSPVDIQVDEAKPCWETVVEALVESSSPEAFATLGFFAGVVVVVVGAVVYRRRHAAGHLEQPFVVLEA